MKITPCVPIHLDILQKNNIKLFIKRDDLTHPLVSGNKWRKMKYNILEAKNLGFETLLTFGGAFSNHIHATAAVGQTFGFKTIGIIRGEAASISNSTLSSCIQMGMQLHFISRSDYKLKNNSDFQKQLVKKFGKCYIVPEGGTNTFAVKGCAEIITETIPQIDAKIDYWTVGCGTGGTASGMILGTKNKSKVIAFSALKGDFHKNDIKNLINDDKLNHWEVNTDYHFGGFARYKPELVEFINNFKKETNIQLEPIYNGKMLFGVFDLIKKGYFPRDSTIVAIHTGGLQGIKGFNERYGNLIS